MKKMKSSKPIYNITDSKGFNALAWETEEGKVVSCNGTLSINHDIEIFDIETGKHIDSIDLRIYCLIYCQKHNTIKISK